MVNMMMYMASRGLRLIKLLTPASVESRIAVVDMIFSFQLKVYGF
jgi:hypothetical protein